MVQVTEVQYRLFLDACRAEVDALAVGAGAGAELRLLGLSLRTSAVTSPTTFKRKSRLPGSK
jgi:hypothetical protein